MTAINYHNQLANFEIDQRVRFISDEGNMHTAIIVDIQNDLLELHFEDPENSQGFEAPSNCYHI
jgi:hypothetical protein